MLISFAWTTAPLLAGAKTMTVREWDHRYAAHFHGGDIVDAWDKLPRAHGRKVATIKLIGDPVRGSTADLLDSDYEAEGLAWLRDHPDSWPKTLFGRKFHPDLVSRPAFNERRRDADPIWIIRFALVSVEV